MSDATEHPPRKRERTISWGSVRSGAGAAKAWVLPAALSALVTIGAGAGVIYSFAGKFFVTTEAQAAQGEKLRTAAEKHEAEGHPVMREKLRVLEADVAEVKRTGSRTDRNLVRLMIGQGIRPVKDHDE